MANKIVLCLLFSALCLFCSLYGQSVCTLSPQTGYCRIYSLKYFYNATSGACEPFIYGGCGGNGNRFDNPTDCNNTCGGQYVCSLLPQPGYCRGYFVKYFYDVTTGECETFVYGGCGGNGNRFDNPTDCNNTCGGY